MNNVPIQKILDQFHDKRILVTGGKGMLGHSFYQKAKQYLPNIEIINLGKDELDVTQQEQVLSWRKWLDGGWIIHCAALVNVESCASNRDFSKNIIVNGTKNIVDLAKVSNSKIFYPQSFLVYDCKVTPVPETAPLTPLSYYGELKAEAESLVLDGQCEHLSVRMAGFFGGEERDKNFVGKIIKHIHQLIENKIDHIKIGDRVWQPTWTDDLALNSLILMASGKRGVAQMACHGSASFYELTKTIAQEFHWDNFIDIIKVSTDKLNINELGKRPSSSELSCTYLRESKLDLQNNWQDALKNYLSHKYFNQYRR